jgi:hypothetical protein
VVFVLLRVLKAMSSWWQILDVVQLEAAPRMYSSTGYQSVVFLPRLVLGAALMVGLELMVGTRDWNKLVVVKAQQS